jgi:hypothetical protein
MSSLIDLLPAIEASGGKLAIAETAAVIADVESWWP